ncbi:MAG: glycosyltransferase family 2 protein [Candidatus Omnitrophica bacterium]|nr:glycosyltransferase family 2 protein [Candidatus Omnitrophota bacterium]
MFLSCVIVAKNEEKNIARCIESILSCIKDIKDTEILLVDSCSSDGTIEIAKRYPINIIRLHDNWQLSPAAGRFSGVNNATGKYILIIDGDMQLLDGWLKPALQFMEENPNVASVLGRHYDVCYLKDGSISEPSLNRACHNLNKLQEIDYVFQSSIFRKESLTEVGNFQPFLRAEEEAEVSHRLKQRGYSLFFLPYDAIKHYRIPTNTIQSTIRRTKNKLWAGVGDMFSWCLQNKYYSIAWKRFREYILFSLLVIISLLGTVVNTIFGKFIFSLIFAAIPVAFVFIMCIKKRSFYQGILSALNYTVISLNLISGFFRKIKDISSYPKDITWIQKL